jgi:hypothetical protein
VCVHRSDTPHTYIYKYLYIYIKCTFIFVAVEGQTIFTSGHDRLRSLYVYNIQLEVHETII